MYFIPIVNPDGVAFIEFAEQGDGTIELKRKNTRISPERKCSPVNTGVDLNRNYNISWTENFGKNLIQNY